VIKYGNAALLWIILTIRLPLVQIAFAITALNDPPDPFRISSVLGLFIILAGLVLYRYASVTGGTGPALELAPEDDRERSIREAAEETARAAASREQSQKGQLRREPSPPYSGHTDLQRHSYSRSPAPTSGYSGRSQQPSQSASPVQPHYIPPPSSQTQQQQQQQRQQLPQQQQQHQEVRFSLEARREAPRHDPGVGDPRYLRTPPPRQNMGAGSY
jgi:hypothetical protein